MPEFRFAMTVDGVERVKVVEIDEHLIRAPDTVPDIWKADYRNNRIKTRLNAWALSQLKLSFEEVIPDGRLSKNDSAS